MLRPSQLLLRSEVAAPYFIGRLTDNPLGVNDESLLYLKEGVEVAFLPAHVFKIDQPPKAFVDELLSKEPKSVWPRQ